MSAYGAFADLYDVLMDDFDYPVWAEYYLEIIRRAGVTPKTICDCACGTGSVSVELAARGIRTTGIDISREMLERASEKARLKGVRAMFVCQDMCALQLPRPVDALICACDGVNYLLTEARLKAFFSRAHASIQSGGVLAFDISSAHKLENVLGNDFFGEERDEIAYLWQNRFSKERRTVQMDITFFAREASGLYRRFTETHTQRAHEIEEITAALIDCGFQDIKIYGDRVLESPKADALRIHFSAVRE